MSTVLVTGANRGIGLELCRQFQSRGEDVVAVCRQRSPELETLGVRVHEGLDVADAASVRALDDSLGDLRLDLLVNNAGILRSDDLDSFEPGDLLEQFTVNATGPLLVTRALLGRLGRGSRIAIITSRMGSIADNGSGGYYGYRMSKAAVNMAGMSLARDLRERGIAVGLLHPGMVATDMTGRTGVPVEAAAAGLVRRMDELTVDNTGGFWHAEGYELPW